MTDCQHQNAFGQYIAGRWRPGRAGTTLQDRNPYD
jgi:hypothetical protein